MLIAREKRRTNVAEYILYMWQVEDMLRALALDIEQVDRHVVSQFRVDEKTKLEIREWYDGYRIGKIDIYASWDVLSYVKDHIANPDVLPKNYWANTSCFHPPLKGILSTKSGQAVR